MKNRINPGLAYAILLISLSQIAIAQNDGTEPIALEGIPTIIGLFEEKPLVALGETHEHVQLYEFLTELVQTKAFYTEVNDILIESGNALYQDVLDKYISGKKVQMDDLQLVWMNTTQSPVDPWSADVYFNFLKTVRDLNKKISKKHQLRVIAADSRIEWGKVNTQEEYLEARGSRDNFYAQTAINEVLKKNRKALMINGGAHYGNHDPKKRKVNQRIEIKYPNSVTVILATSGIGRGYEDREKALNWKSGTITKVQGTWIGERPGPRRVMMTVPASTPSGTASASATPVPRLL